MTPTFTCPLCDFPLTQTATECFCPYNHHFDRAKEGYVNLLPPNEKASKDPGDAREMVQARSAFLEKGFYDALANAVSELCLKLAPDKNPAVADIGCGQGYYTQHAYRSMVAAGRAPSFTGIDISKNALKYAAKQEPNIAYAVASVKKLPLPKESAHLLLNIFAPRNFAEFARVLKPGGHAVIVSPGPEHLRGLKPVLLLKESNHEAPVFEAESSLQRTQTLRIQDDITLHSAEDVLQLCMMTPFWWKITREGREGIAAVSQLNLTLDFTVNVFVKA